MLEWKIEVGKYEPLGHQRDDVVDVRVGVDVVQAHPGSETPKLAREVGHVGADLSAFPWAGLMPDVDAVSRRVLADHQQLPGSGGNEFLRLAQDGVGAAAYEVAAKMRNDAECAAVVTAFGDLQVAVVARGKLEAGLGHQIDERVRDRRCRLMDRGDNFLILLRSGDGED